MRGVGAAAAHFPPFNLLAEQDQVALTGSTPLCGMLHSLQRQRGVKGVEITSLENRESRRLSFLVKTDAWLYKMLGGIYYYPILLLSL